MNSESITFQCRNLPCGIKLDIRDKGPALHEDMFTHAAHAEIEWHKPNDRPNCSCNIITLSYDSGHYYTRLLSYDNDSNSYSEISWEGLDVWVDVVAWAYPPEVKVVSEKGDQEFLVEWC